MDEQETNVDRKRCQLCGFVHRYGTGRSKECTF